VRHELIEPARLVVSGSYAAQRERVSGHESLWSRFTFCRVVKLDGLVSLQVEELIQDCVNQIVNARVSRRQCGSTGFGRVMSGRADGSEVVRTTKKVSPEPECERSPNLGGDPPVGRRRRLTVSRLGDDLDLVGECHTENDGAGRARVPLRKTSARESRRLNKLVTGGMLPSGAGNRRGLVGPRPLAL
jgi:hypothetical protein